LDVANSQLVEMALQEMIENGFEKTPQFIVSSEENIKNSKLSDFDNSIDYGNKDYIGRTISSQLYSQQAMEELQNNFPYLKVKGLSKLFAQNQYHYFPTLSSIEDILDIKAVLKAPIRDNESAFDLTSHKVINSVRMSATELKQLNKKCEESGSGLSVKATLKKSNAHEIIHLDPVLEKEIKWTTHKKIAEREIEKIRKSEEWSQKIAEEDGTLIECACCCADYAFELLVQCSEGHLFCKPCLSRYAEQTVFGDGKSSLSCIDSSGSDPCEGIFSENTLKHALDEKVFLKYQEALIRDALKAANIVDLKSCHFCQFQVEISAEAGTVLHCPNCYKDTCVLVKKQS
jgi:TRIAD3 protein (E3 ubiquitin-protein ligase RNF216)